MPFLMRVIRRNRWYPEGLQPWLRDREPSADSLLDLQTEGNQLSVWLIDDNLSNLYRIAAALAAARQSLSPFDYRLVSLHAVTRLRVRLAETPGDSADPVVNRLWHRDLPRLSAAEVLSLARCLWRWGESKRISRSEVQRLLTAAVRSGTLSVEALHPNLRGKLKG